MKAVTTSPLPTAESHDEQSAGAPKETATAAQKADGGRLYRGRTVAELIPKIQADLGSEAVVTGRRSGLEGGIAGFFQRPFVEIQAQPGGPRLDIRDGEQELPPLDFEPDPLTALGADASPASEVESFESFQPGTGAAEDGFAGALAAASGEEAEEFQTEGPLPVSSPVAAGAAYGYALAATNGSAANGNGAHAVAPAAAGIEAPRSRAEAALAAELAQAGFDEAFAAGILDTATAHVLAFTPRLGLRRAARVALERHLPHAAPAPAHGGLVVLVGPGGAGKTKCVECVAERYQRSSTVAVGRGELSLEADGKALLTLSPHIGAPAQLAAKEAQSALTVARTHGLALLDTPALSPADAGGVKALARVIGGLAPERVIVALPATLSASAATRLLEAMRALKPDAVAITHADESDQLGVAVQAACAFGLAVEYVLTGARGERALARIEPSTLAERLLP